MRRILPAMTALITAAFPHTAEWCRLPSFIGWVAVSSGIATQKLVPWNHVFASLLYNRILFVAIILSLVASIAVSYLPLRFLFFAAVGLFLASWSSNEQHIVYGTAMRALAGQRSVGLSARIVSIPTVSFGEYCFTVRADSVFTRSADNQQGMLYNKTLTCYSYRKPPLYGSLTARGRFTPPRPAENPGAFDEYQNSMANNIWGRFYIDTILQSRTEQSCWDKASDFTRAVVVKACSNIRNSDYRAVIVASFLNDRSDLSNGIRDVFYKAGIYHLLALSGFNIAILASALFAFLTLLPMSKTIKAVIVLVCIWSYYLFIGPIPSLFRAAIMMTVVLAAYLFQRKPHALNSLGLAGIIWLFFSPSSLFTPSYQLSFFATLGLVTIYPVLSRRFMPHKRTMLAKWLITPFFATLFVSISAFIATAPVLACHFGTLSLSGIIANLFAVTLMSISMWIALVGFFMQLCIPFFVPFCMHAAELTVDIMIRCSALVAMLPMASIHVFALHPLVYALYAMVCTGFCTVRKELTRRYLFIAVPAAIVISAGLLWMQTFAIHPEITLFYHKKASVTGVRWPNGRLWLIGTGPEGSAYSTFSRIIMPWMRQNLANRIDAVVLVDDPCNTVQSLEPLLKSAGVTTIIMPSSGGQPSCSDFPLFLHEYGVIPKMLDTGEIVSPAPQCSFMVVPQSIVSYQGCARQVKINIYNSTVYIPDSLYSPKETSGAISLVFSKTHGPVVTQEIPLSHPLYSPP